MRKSKVFPALFLALALSVVCASSAWARTLIPGGQSIGVTVSTGGLVVTGASDVGATPSPGRLAGIQKGDVIVSVDNTPVAGAESLGAILTSEKCDVVFLRGDEQRRVTLTPAYDQESGMYRLGLWVREGTAGIGTLTFYDPQTAFYGALGHAVTDEDSGIVLPIQGGAIYENSIINVEKGRGGQPGEIMGQFFDGGYLGTVTANTDCGIYGQLDESLKNPLYPDGLEAAEDGEIRTGSAKILTSVDQEGLREYDCEIVRLSAQSDTPDKSFTIRITDGELIRRTGGIVQGMSGSPVIQDGRIVGAVTHVLVNDPTMGYGLSIDRMLSSAA